MGGVGEGEGKKGYLLMNVMTINLRYRNPQDWDNHWDDRKHLVVNLIEKYLPALIGTQEGFKDQLDDIARMSPGYAYIDAQKLVSIQRQCPTIFYRRDLLTPVSAGNFWLSEIPGFPDSKSWDSAFPRLVTHAFFKIKETDQFFFFFNTHFDHQSAWARRESTFLLIKKIKEINPKYFPTIIVGDFNMGCDTMEHELLTGKIEIDDVKGWFQNVWEKLGKPKEGAETYHGFSGIPKKEQMDWILATSHFRFLDIRKSEDNQDGKYPTDHFPVFARLVLPFTAHKKNPDKK
jgi:endonuclease/exonuclease/phosphatase family metal-dependent hydrolase